jgi:hypothetical protein
MTGALPPRIHVVTFQSLAGVLLEEHGVTGDYLRVLREMFEDVRVLSVDRCTCEHCTDERARYLAEPAPDAATKER